MAQTAGKLIVVATPIGNLGDMTPRALEALNAADTVYAEDTRVTMKLLTAFGLKARLERLDENTIGSRCAQVVERILAGEVAAYCTDAGMPGISDPGMRLVAAAREAGARVEVLPGASAVSTAYVASGTANPRYYFGGFFPRKAAERTSLLETLKPLDAALVFYESPHRVASALAVIAEAYPHRSVAVCRELTKLHEEVFRASTGQAADEFARRADAGEIRGEFVIVIDGPSDEEGADDARCSREKALALAARLREEGTGSKDIARRLTRELGIARNEAYDIALGR